MIEPEQIELVYEGEEVADGTLQAQYFIDVLSGFSGAYQKLSCRGATTKSDYKIKVIGVEKNSIHILLSVMQFVHNNPEEAMFYVVAASTCLEKVLAIARYIKGKIHIQGECPENVIVAENGKLYLRQVATGKKLEISKQEAKLLSLRALDADVEKMVRALSEKGISSFEIRNKTKAIVRATYKDKAYLGISASSNTLTGGETWLRGALNSLTKDKARGTFFAIDGGHYQYRYIGDDHNELMHAFSVSGFVDVFADVVVNNNRVHHIDIRQISIPQASLF